MAPPALCFGTNSSDCSLPVSRSIPICCAPVVERTNPDLSLLAHGRVEAIHFGPSESSLLLGHSKVVF